VAGSNPESHSTRRREVNRFYRKERKERKEHKETSLRFFSHSVILRAAKRRRRIQTPHGFRNYARNDGIYEI
jgi:phosphopantothenate synthetase